MNTEDPREMKALGRLVKDFDASVWDDVGFDLVVKGNLEKFRQNPIFRDTLLATGSKVLAPFVPFARALRTPCVRLRGASFLFWHLMGRVCFFLRLTLRVAGSNYFLFVLCLR